MIKMRENNPIIKETGSGFSRHSKNVLILLYEIITSLYLLTIPAYLISIVLSAVLLGILGIRDMLGNEVLYILVSTGAATVIDLILVLILVLIIYCIQIIRKKRGKEPVAENYSEKELAK